VAFYQGAPGKEHATPVAVGLRPGYLYRVRLSNMPDLPGAMLFPTLEVQGTLLAHELRPADYPAPISFSREDLQRVAAGAMITKVIYLEDPLQAMPTATRPDEPIELELRPSQDLLMEARLRGRPLVIVRLGARQFTDQQLAFENVPGTILLPGEPALAPAAAAPMLGFACVNLFDPKLGPRCPTDECLKDGGDIGRPAGFDRDGKLQGVDPSDTVAEYRDSCGVRRLTPSNRVCVCVPRFAAVASLLLPTGYDIALNLGDTQGVVGGALMRNRIPIIELEQPISPEVLLTRERASATENGYQALTVDQLRGPVSVHGVIGNVEVEGVCVEKPGHPGHLVLCKTVDRHTAHVGDLVTFTLRYTNEGGQPISEVAVNDSLTGRLEYVPGSAKTDRAAAFTMVPNEEGSLMLRWAISGNLLPGESGLISFQVRVR
jgi:uncharacterized repeat protein (TIGR01451 family)